MTDEPEHKNVTVLHTEIPEGLDPEELVRAIGVMMKAIISFPSSMASLQPVVALRITIRVNEDGSRKYGMKVVAETRFNDLQ